MLSDPKCSKVCSKWEVCTNQGPSLSSGLLTLRKSEGATLEEPAREGEDLRINGSVLLALAESREEVVKVLQQDIYYKSGVWDWDKVAIHPVCCKTDTQDATR